VGSGVGEGVGPIGVEYGVGSGVGEGVGIHSHDSGVDSSANFRGNRGQKQILHLHVPGTSAKNLTLHLLQ
jgi:hypothetical protein